MLQNLHCRFEWINNNKKEKEKAPPRLPVHGHGKSPQCQRLSCHCCDSVRGDGEKKPLDNGHNQCIPAKVADPDVRMAVDGSVAAAHTLGKARAVRYVHHPVRVMRFLTADPQWILTPARLTKLPL